MLSRANSYALAAAAILLPAALLAPNIDPRFDNDPVLVPAAKNAYAGQEEAAQGGKKLCARNGPSCHGKTGNGTDKTSSLVDGTLGSVTPGEVFWFIWRGPRDQHGALGGAGRERHVR